MKKHLKFSIYYIGCAFLFLQYSAYGETVVHGIKLSTEQEATFQKLTKLYSIQISHHFDLCNTGKHPKYKRQEPGEFEHLFKKSEKNLLDTIQSITKLYAEVGVPQDKIQEEEAALRSGIQNCI